MVQNYKRESNAGTISRRKEGTISRRKESIKMTYALSVQQLRRPL
jgi:hypothetical protein